MEVHLDENNEPFYKASLAEVEKLLDFASLIVEEAPFLETELNLLHDKIMAVFQLWPVANKKFTVSHRLGTAFDRAIGGTGIRVSKEAFMTAYPKMNLSPEIKNNWKLDAEFLRHVREVMRPGCFQIHCSKALRKLIVTENEKESPEVVTKTAVKFDEVKKPAHYNLNPHGIECIQAIEASMSREEFLGYLKGNALKYLWRWRYKNHPEQDLAKATDYIRRLQEAYKKEQE